MKRFRVLIIAGAAVSVGFSAYAGDFKGADRRQPDAYARHAKHPKCSPHKAEKAEEKSAGYARRSEQAAADGRDRYADRYADKSARYAEKAEKYGCADGAGPGDGGPPDAPPPPPPPEVG